MAQTATQAGSLPDLPDLSRHERAARAFRLGAQDPEFHRIRRIAFGLAISVLLVVVGGVTLATVQEYRERNVEAEAHVLSVARAIEPYLGRMIRRAGDYLERRRIQLETAGGPDAMTPAQMEAIYEGRPKDDVVLRYIIISDASGQTLLVSGAGRGAVPSVRERAFFQYHRNHRDRAARVSQPFKSRIDGKWRLPISVRIDRPDGTFAGVVNTAVEVEYLAHYFASLGLPQGAIVHLTTDQGDSLARHPPPERPIDKERLARTVRGFIGGESSFRTHSPVTGADNIGAFRRVGDLPIYAIVAFSADDVFAGWRRNTVVRIATGVGGLALTAFFTLLLLHHLRAEQAAVSNLTKFRRAVDLSGDFIYWVDISGRIVYMNDAAGRRLGLDPKRLRPTLNIRDISGTYSDERWQELRDKLLRNGEAAYQSEHYSRDGSRYPVQVSATHLRFNDEDFGFLIARDLSRQVQQERAIRELNASLEVRVGERTAQLAAANGELESFAYSVSHDLRAPLNHIMAYAEELAEAACGDPQECRRLTAKVIERSQYMNELIEGLLALSRIGRARLERVEMNLSSIAREVDAGHRRLERGRKVETLIQDGMKAAGDPVLIRTLLENLVGNAWKYTSKKDEARVEIFTEDHDGKTVFVVRDNGAGFDPRYAARLFGTFHRLHSQAEFPGSGIGLATARRIVTRHGGRIWADGEPNAGATFRFTLGV